MDISEKILDLLFRRIPPERILRRLRLQLSGPALSGPAWRKTFLEFAESTLHGYSGDEHALFCDQLEQAVRRRADELRVQPSALLTLLDLGQEVLTTQGDEPLCRSSRILRWRDAYHLFGQDMLVCAYLAYCDIRFQTHRENFAWPAVLRTDDGILRQALAQGIAENHFHLNGSTQAFALAWCSLMNDPGSIGSLPGGFSRLLQSVSSRGPEDNVLPPEDRLVIAALARSILFRALHPGAFHAQGMSSFHSPSAFWSEYIDCFSPVSRLIDLVRVLQESCGVWIALPDGESACFDYALELPVFHVVRDSPYRVLAGERYFLYQCFTACFSGRFSPFEQTLFYLYLSLKTAFRGEMIQVNRQVGFQNFADYEERKDLAWTGAYRWEAYRMALNAPLLTSPTRSLEARLTPAGTREEMIQKVLRYDLGKHFADLPYQPLPPEQCYFEPERSADRFLREPHFYVLHFPKRHDDPLPPAFSLEHRHQALREEVRARARALAEALSVSPYLCSRIRGIDGCANEVDCRPEVFAAAFRYLRSFQSTEPWTAGSLLPAPVHRLSVTYHAGEDFYDIADGLRAIDEAMCFLDYRRGDRIGHALALGVDPQIHYQMKSMSIVLPKQNRLDDLVWLIFRGRALGVPIDPQLYGALQQEALWLLQDIYGDAISRNNWSITLQDYFCSMLLRGDAPELYRTMSFQMPEALYDSQYSRCQITSSRSAQDLMPFRQSWKIAGMYYYYHYGWREKREGRKSIRISIRPDYIALLRQMQLALQQHLAARGILIECNPSSNVLIGTFGEYARHPITRFNHMGLTAPPDLQCAQLHVCVNTDDLGVFDTSLEFEYALLYRALSSQTDADGRPLYTAKSILSYLQNVREMGLQAVFPPPEQLSSPAAHAAALH
ncbi:MAG: hypothetical protein K2O93_09645 [Oscillospiraceae bacterium]|nr:hypothetical protein [Oscillospiraceae bacterium]